MPTTPEMNIWTPASVDDYHLTVDLATMAQTVEEGVLSELEDRVATPAMIEEGTDDEHFITPAGLAEVSPEQKVLWHSDSGVVLTDAQTVTLSETVSDQPTGIILVWTRRAGSGQPENSNFNYTSIPKAHVNGVVASGTYGVNCLLADGNILFRKYVYVTDTHLTGLSGNGSGDGASQTLRWVLGY